MQLKKVLPGKVVSRKIKNTSPRHGTGKILKRVVGADEKKLESVGDTSQVSKQGHTHSADKLSRDNSSKRRKANLSHSKSSNKRSKQSNSNDAINNRSKLQKSHM